MKSHISRTTISCSKGFVFLLFRPYWSFSQNHTLRLVLHMVKLQHGNIKKSLWKTCSEMMPRHHFTSKCHSHPPSCQDTWGCWEPAAPAGAHSKGSGAVTVALTGQCAMAQLLPVPWPAAHSAFGCCLHGSKNLLSTLSLLYPEGKAPCIVHFWKTNAQPGNYLHCFSCGFFPSDGAWGCFRSSRCDTLWQAGPELRGTASMHLLEIAIPLAMCMC